MFEDDFRHDPMAGLDFKRDYAKDHSPCPKCGFPDPVRIDSLRGCEQCATFDTCACGRWTFSEYGGACPVCVTEGPLSAGGIYRIVA